MVMCETKIKEILNSVNVKSETDLVLFKEVLNTLFEFEVYKSKIDLEPDCKICFCYKQIYKNVLTLGEYILVNKFVGNDVTLSCVYKMLPVLKNIDVRPKVIAYMFLRPLIKHFIRRDLQYFLNHKYDFIKFAKLTLAGIHINCEKLLCSENGTCYYYKTNKKYCKSHENGIEKEYIRFYVFPFIIENKAYWIRYFIKTLREFHIDYENIIFIIDYKNMKHYYEWDKYTISRFELVKHTFNEIYIINYDNVNFGKYYNEIKKYLSSEEEIEKKTNCICK